MKCTRSGTDALSALRRQVNPSARPPRLLAGSSRPRACKFTSWTRVRAFRISGTRRCARLLAGRRREASKKGRRTRGAITTRETDTTCRRANQVERDEEEMRGAPRTRSGGARFAPHTRSNISCTSPVEIDAFAVGDCRVPRGNVRLVSVVDEPCRTSSVATFDRVCLARAPSVMRSSAPPSPCRPARERRSEVTQSATSTNLQAAGARARKKSIGHTNALACRDGAELEAQQEGKNDAMDRARHGRRVDRSRPCGSRGYGVALD